MAIITISRGSFSGGKILAECLAGKLGFRCIDRDVIVEKAAAYGVKQEDLLNALDRPPSFWDRFKHKKYIYLTLIQAALVEEVKEGKAIYHGHAGHLLLRGVSNVLRTRIIAPMEFRIAMVGDRLKLDRNEAVSYIQKMDANRKKWTQYLYGVDWCDPHLYDVVFNLECLDIEQACDVLSAMAHEPCFEGSPETLAAMEDLHLASKVRVNLVIHPSTSNMEVDVTARQGEVSISGRLASEAEIKEVERIALQVSGVHVVNLDGLVLYQDV